MSKLSRIAPLRLPAISGLSAVNRTLVLTVQGLSLSVLYVLFYGPLVPGLVSDWSTNSSFAYGFLVPFISSYLIWHDRAKLQSLPVVPTLLGSIPLVSATSLALVGDAVGDVFTMRVAMVLSLGSSAYLLLGKDFIKALLFPLLYLALMIPLPYVVTKELSYNLRFFDSICSEGLLRIIGIPVYRDSYFLHLPNITLEVADACSGIASMFALFALALVYAYFLPVSRTAKLFVSASAVPVAILANLFRIVVTATLTYYLGPVVLSSPIHYAYSAFNFVVGFALLILVGEMLQKKWSTYPEHQTSHKQVGEPTMNSDRVVVGWSSFIAGVSIFVIGLWLSVNLRAEHKASVDMNLAELSSSLAHLYPSVASLWTDPYEDTKADTSLEGVYVGPGGVPVELFVAYRGIQDGGNRLRSPKLVFPEGWNFVWVEPTEIEIDDNARITANWMLTRRGSSQRLVLYWYQDRELSFAGELHYRLKLFKRRLLGDRTDGTVVRIATPLKDGENLKQAQQRLSSFALNLYPHLVQLHVNR